MASNKPVLASNQIPSSKKIPPQKVEKKLKWCFSFEFYRQIEYFGLDKSESKWFVSLLERLAELSSKNLEEFKSKSTQQSYRYHKINWSARNIPIQRSDLNWLPKDYLENETDFPILQIQVSKSLGRIIGFWNETYTIFYIVLLDPLHNLQPSKVYDYEVNDCGHLDSDYTSLLRELELFKTEYKDRIETDVFYELSKLGQINTNKPVFLISIDPSYINEYYKLERNATIGEIFELGILHYSAS